MQIRLSGRRREFYKNLSILSLCVRIGGQKSMTKHFLRLKLRYGLVALTFPAVPVAGSCYRLIVRFGARSGDFSQLEKFPKRYPFLRSRSSFQDSLSLSLSGQKESKPSSSSATSTVNTIRHTSSTTRQTERDCRSMETKCFVVAADVKGG